MTMRSIFSLLLLAALAAPLDAQPARQTHPIPLSLAPIAGPLKYEPQPFDVLHYDAWIDLTKAPAKDMSGVCEITLMWTGDPASGPFYFHLRDLTIDSAYYDGAAVMPIEKESPSSPTYHYEILPPPSAKAGDTATIRIVYHGTMTDERGFGTWGGVSSGGGTLYALGVGFSNNYVSATQHWLPCYDHPSDKATFRGRFRVRAGKTVASNGLVTIVPESDTTVVYDWRHDYRCATYLLTFAVANYIPLEFPGETPPMVIYSLPDDTARTRLSFKLLPRMVRTLEGRFGAYPFEKVGYVNTPQGSMEHQTMVSIDIRVSRGGDTVNNTGAHELAHQWFGDLVSPRDFRHAWLTESFATFCESLWNEELFGYAGYLRTQEGDMNSYFGLDEGLLPLYDFPRASPSSNYPYTIYVKGSVVVGMLRYELGDSIFFAGIRDYLSANAYGTATTEMLRAALEARAGRSLEWFFSQWVYGKGWPVVTAAFAKEPIGGGLTNTTVTLAQVQADSLGTFVNLPVEIGFRSESGEYTYRMLTMTERTQTFRLDSLPDFRSITLNRGPSVRALMRGTALSGVELRAASDSNAAIEFIVRPNPMTGAAAFTVETKGTGDCAGTEYELYDSAGRRLLLGRTDVCSFPIPATGFNSGVYVLRFKFRGLYYDVPVMIAR